MKVILLQDVKSLGKKGETVEINDGYARNYVIPKKLGLEANSKNINDLKLQKANEEKKEQEKIDKAIQQANEIEGKHVTIGIKVGEGGRIFGTISSKEVSKAILDQLGYEIDKKKMVLDEPIKTPGTHIIVLKLYKNVTAKLSVRVVEE